MCRISRQYEKNKESSFERIPESQFCMYLSYEIKFVKNPDFLESRERRGPRPRRERVFEH